MNLLIYLNLLFLICIFGCLDCNIDFDFWARLVVGKTYFQTGHLFNNDFYSYGTTHEFIDHEWGSGVVFYLLQEKFGDIGIFIFKSLMIFLTFLIIIKVIKLRNKNISLYFLPFFFAIQAISYNIFSTIRCQTFSFFFFVLYILVLEFARNKKKYRILWTLPFLNIIWQNMHGGFVVGLAIIFIYFMGEFLNKNEYKYYLASFLACIPTLFINPYGYKYLIYIFGAFNLDRTYITEWKSVFFEHTYLFTMLKFKIFFFFVLILFLFCIAKNIIKFGIKEHYFKIDKVKYLIIIFTTIISIKHLRCHPFFVYSVLIFCINDFYEIFNKKLPKTFDNLKEILLCILLFISFLSHIFDFKFQNIVKSTQYPIFCTEFIKKNNLKGNVFTNFHTGSYVIYKLYPNNHIFMDGRYEEVYDNNLINDMAVFFLATNYKQFLKKYHSDILIIDKTYAVYYKLKDDRDWFLAYENDNFALFLPAKLKNKKFIMPTEDLNYYNSTKFKTNIDWNK